MQNQNTFFVCRKPVMSGVSHSAAFDRANSSAKLLRVRICTCHWPWSQLKTHRFLCKNHRLEKANDGTGFKKPDKLTININIIQHDTSSAKSPMNTSRSPCFTPPGHRVLAVALDNISWLSVKCGLKTMLKETVLLPGTPGTSGPAGLRFRSQGWMKSTSLADPTGTGDFHAQSRHGHHVTDYGL